MESIGEKLRKAREEKSLSVDQVARDTNIAKRYIVALEDEAFAEFPGEPYLIGFLRNYSDYLGLDTEEIVGLYKNFKIQEQPVPMEELLEPKRSAPKPALLVIGILVVALIVAGVFLYPALTGHKNAKTASRSNSLAAGAGTEIKLTDEFIEQRFVSGDSVLVPVGGKSYKVTMTEQGNGLLLTYSAGTTTLQVGEEKNIDLSGNSVPDLKVTLQEFNAADPARGFVVRFDRFTQSPAGAPAPQQTAAAGQPPAAQAGAPPAASAAAPTPAAPQAAATGAEQPQTVTQPAAPEAAPPAPAAAATAAPATPALAAATPSASASQTVPTVTPQSNGYASSGPTVILQAAAATPFTMDVSFDGYCVFRSAIDGQASQQHYFQSGETTTLEVGNTVEIWASNGGALQATISGKNVDMGNAGQVIARKIAWVKDDASGMYDLEMTRMP